MMRAGWVAAIGVVLSVATAYGQGTILDGAARFAINANHFDASPSANMAGVATPLAQDQLFESGWWYRVSGDTSETFFPPPDSQVYSGDTATITWTNVNARGFSAVESIRIEDGGGPSGSVTDTMTVTNLGPASLDIVMFHMADVNLTATAADDSGVLLVPNTRIGMSDGSNTSEYLGVGADAYLVRPAGVIDVAAVLSNALMTTFGNSGLPFGPGSMTAGFQWNTVTIAPGASRSYTAVLSVNTPAVAPTTTSTSTSSSTSSSSTTSTSSSTSTSSTTSTSSSSTTTSTSTSSSSTTSTSSSTTSTSTTTTSSTTSSTSSTSTTTTSSSSSSSTTSTTATTSSTSTTEPPSTTSTSTTVSSTTSSTTSSTSTTMTSSSSSSSTTSTTEPPSTTSTTVIGSTTSTSTMASTTSTLVSTTTVSSTTTTVASTTTTSTTPTIELCGNCLDDDGDGLVDTEDEACCAAASATSFRLRRGYLHPTKDGTARLRLKGRLSVGGLTAGAVSSQDVTILVRTATDEVLCAQIPAANLVRRKTKLKFRDKRAQLASAGGINKVTITSNKDGTGHLGMRGTSVALTVPEVEALTMTLGLRDPAGAESGNYCARGTAVFRSTSKGLRYP